IVDPLEKIDVDHGEMDAALAVRLANLLSHPSSFRFRFRRGEILKRLFEGAAVQQAGEIVAIAVVEDAKMIAIDPKQAENQAFLIIAQRRRALDFDKADDVAPVRNGKDVAV